MNLESNSTQKKPAINVVDDLDFEFRPITSGLGFHQQTTTEVKPVFHETPVPKPVIARAKIQPQNQTTVYQNDLSIFYGNQLNQEMPATPKAVEKIVRQAKSSQRVIAYCLDLATLLSCLGLVLTVMARLIHMDIAEAWSSYPNEITPLVVTLFVGFYLIYFSIFEKTTASTLGKNLVGLTVVKKDNKTQSFNLLFVRSLITLANFVSLGLFAYFNLQDKVSQTQVIKVD